jgi:hypothetical protein
MIKYKIKRLWDIPNKIEELRKEALTQLREYAMPVAQRAYEKRVNELIAAGSRFISSDGKSERWTNSSAGNVVNIAEHEIKYVIGRAFARSIDKTLDPDIVDVSLKVKGYRPFPVDFECAAGGGQVLSVLVNISTPLKKKLGLSSQNPELYKCNELLQYMGLLNDKFEEKNIEIESLVLSKDIIEAVKAKIK